MVAVASADTLLLAISTLVGIAGALGVAYTVFRSASEQRLREVDQHIITNQGVLMGQFESELAKCRADLIAEKQRSDTYRETLTQRAAVDHLSEIVLREDQIRREEHAAQVTLLRDVLAQLKGQRGVIG